MFGLEDDIVTVKVLVKREVTVWPGGRESYSECSGGGASLEDENVTEKA